MRTHCSHEKMQIITFVRSLISTGMPPPSPSPPLNLIIISFGSSPFPPSFAYWYRALAACKVTDCSGDWRAHVVSLSVETPIKLQTTCYGIRPDLKQHQECPRMLDMRFKR